MPFRRCIARGFLAASGVVFCLATAACASSEAAAPPPNSASLPSLLQLPGALRDAVQRPPYSRVRRSTNSIQHVVIIVQENESFNHLFMGYPGANTSATGKIHTGQTVTLTEQDLGAATNTNHWASSFISDYNGGAMDGFDLNQNSKPNLLAYTYINPSDIQPYYQMAQQYVLSDNFFTSHIDASFVAHQYLVAAQANHAVNLPSGNYGCDDDQNDYVPTLTKTREIGPFESPCFNINSLAQELDDAGYTWHFYAPYITCPPSDPSCDTSGGIWSAFQAINYVYNGPDWAKDVISPETQVLTDIGNGTLENVTWVVPSYINSDHPGSNSMTGPSWVASVVNAIGTSQFWDSTEIFIMWDEWGGEYDPVAPPYKDYDGDGFRVPLLCISPYAYPGTVNHTELEVGGIDKAVETIFGLKAMAAADTRAQPADTGCINPSQSTPRQFTQITSEHGRNYFLHVQKRNDHKPPDDY